MADHDIINFVKISDQISTAGQPSAAQLTSLADAGYQAVINLAPYKSDNGSIADEADIVTCAGLTYIHIPVEWSAPLRSDLELFFSAMDTLSMRKTLIHCIANLRVTAFYSLYAEKRMGWSGTQANSLLDPLWADRPEYEEGGVWRAFIDQCRQEIRAD